MLTFLQEKNQVAAVLGKIDGSTANTIRDNAINEVRQFDIANAYPFSWLEKSLSVTTAATGKVDLPADFNITHKIKFIIDGDETYYSQINKEVYHDYGAGDHVYFIDYNTSTDRWQINCTEVSTALTGVYYYVPATLSSDATIDPIPDLTVIKYLAASRYWLTERNYGNYDRFNDLGNQRLQSLINKDKKANPTRLTRISSADLGYNRSD